MNTNETKAQLAPVSATAKQVTLFQVTTAQNAKHIATRGFADNSARHLEGTEYNGVWLASAPPQVTVVTGPVLVKVELDVAPNDLNHFESRVLGDDTREWLIAADRVNAHIVSLIVGEVTVDWGSTLGRGRGLPDEGAEQV